MGVKGFDRPREVQHKVRGMSRACTTRASAHSNSAEQPEIEDTRLTLHECKAGMLSRYPAPSVPMSFVHMILVLTVKISTRQRVISGCKNLRNHASTHFPSVSASVSVAHCIDGNRD